MIITYGFWDLCELSAGAANNNPANNCGSSGARVAGIVGQPSSKSGANVFQISTNYPSNSVYPVENIRKIILASDDSLGSKLGITCNTTLATITGGLAISGRNPGVSFTISFNGTISGNKLCLSYQIIN